MTDKERYYSRLYKNINKITGEKTPLKKDCGQVCSSEFSRFLEETSRESDLFLSLME